MTMHGLAWTGLCVAATGVIVVWERKRMDREVQHTELIASPVPEQELDEDTSMDMLIAPTGFEQHEPILRELQAAIKAADDVTVKRLFAEMGARHPDAMKLDRGLKPLQLAAHMRVRLQEHDRRLKNIMRTLLERGALITQRENISGATIMHLLACQPLKCHVTHRIKFLLNVLEEYRNGPGPVAPMPGLMFDPVLNGATPATGGGDAVGIAVHLLGMRCYQETLPEDLAPAGDRRSMLTRHRRMLPPGLQDAGQEETGADYN